jgi:origin recognition complex subunit 1
MPHKTSTPQQHNAKAERARRLLAGSAVSREDSDDELGYEDLPWEWIYEAQKPGEADQNGNGGDEDATASTKTRRNKPVRATSRPQDQKIIGARMGSFHCQVGDCVLLKAEGEGSKAWVGMICEFAEDETGEKSANVMCKKTGRYYNSDNTLLIIPRVLFGARDYKQA